MTGTAKPSSRAYSAVLATLVLGLLGGCGIYVVTEAPQAPYNTSLSQITLKFHGENDEPYFRGYNLWYRFNENEPYKLCDYVMNTRLQMPTLEEAPPVDSDFEVSIADLETFEGKSFEDIDEPSVYFAVSAYGIIDGSDTESEKISFGVWIR